MTLQTTHDGANKSQSIKTSSQTINPLINNETIINSITGFEKDFQNRLEILEREAEIHSRQVELGECLEYVAQLVDLFKHTVVKSELKNQNDWHSSTCDDLQKHKGITGNRLLDDKVENIVMSKGLNKEQWSYLLYIAFSNGDAIEISKVSRKHLQKVHDMALRLLDSVEQKAVFALIQAIEKYMPNKYFIQK